MRLEDAGLDLRDRLRAAHLDLECLDLWEAWKIFKAWLRVPADDPELYDAASFQLSPPEPSHAGFFRRPRSEPGFACFVRPFSRRDPEGEDAGVLRVVVKLFYADQVAASWNELDWWTHDFETLEDFASVVEGLEEFQDIVNRRPVSSSVYAERL